MSEDLATMGNNLTVLFLIDTLQTGGAEKSILDIASNFKKYRPVVCHIYPGDQLKDQYLAAGINVHSLNIDGHYNFSKAAAAVSQLVRDIKPALIHSTLFRSDIISRLVAGKNKVLLINSLVNNSYHVSRFRNAGLLLKMKLKMVQLIDTFLARRVDHFISNSVTIKDAGVADLKIPSSRISVIYRGRSVSEFDAVDNEKKEALKRELQIQDRKILLNVSRLIERKGQLDLLKALVKVIHHDPRVMLLIAGDGPLRVQLEDQIKSLGLTDHVKLLGNRADVPALLSISSLFVFPSHYEGLPGALIEAMLAGVPVVASSIPENLECVDESSSFLHKPGDVADLGRALAAALSATQRASSHAIVARNQAIEKFDIRKISAQTERLYDELLEGQSK